MEKHPQSPSGENSQDEFRLLIQGLSPIIEAADCSNRKLALRLYELSDRIMQMAGTGLLNELDEPEPTITQYMATCIEAATRLLEIEQLNTDNGQDTERTWGCGWAKSTGRCSRFHCKNNGPCDGYQGK